jgi:hypothetical protein
MLGAHREAKLEGHIEAGQCVLVQLNPTEIVNGVTAFAYERAELGEADVCAIGVFECTADLVAAVCHSEEQRLEAGAVLFVEGAVDEDVIRLRTGQGVLTASRCTPAQPCGLLFESVAW